MFERTHEEKGKKMNWIIISVLAGIFYAFMILGITYLTKIKRLSVISVNFQYLPIIFFFLIPIIFLLEGGIVIPGLKTLTILITAGGLSFLGNLTLVKAIKTAPNPGYANAISSVRMIGALFLSYLILRKVELEITGVVGVLMIFTGIIVLSL